jgi:FKBP-type peptidyl-prolyl cis-trans isomerase (trigger factor)
VTRRPRDPFVEQMLASKLHDAPSVQADGGPPPVVTRLADVEALRIEPVIEPPSDDELVLAWQAARRARSEIEPHTTVDAGDEVCVDIVGYAGGEVAPGTSRAHLWLTAESDGLLPGLRDALEGTELGMTKAVPVVLPEDYPVPGLAGVEVVFAVTPRISQRVAWASVDEASIESEMNALADELVEERAEQAVADAALSALVEGSEIEVDEKLVDAELKARFAAEEGALLTAADISVEEQRRCLDARLGDAGERQEARFRLRAAAAIAALRERAALTLERDDVAGFVRAFAEESGLSEDEVKSALADDERAAAEVEEALARTQAIAYLLSMAEVAEPVA